MKLTKIYVGSNNDTKVLEIDKIIAILGNFQAGYTLYKAQGSYGNISEDTCVIEIYSNYNTGIIPELKRELKQDSILVAEFISEAKFY